MVNLPILAFIKLLALAILSSVPLYPLGVFSVPVIPAFDWLGLVLTCYMLHGLFMTIRAFGPDALNLLQPTTYFKAFVAVYAWPWWSMRG